MKVIGNPLPGLLVGNNVYLSTHS